MHAGILFWTVIFGMAGAALPLGRWWGMAKGMYIGSLCAAALAAVASLMHMHRCLERALSRDGGDAQKMIFRGYVIRYAAAAILIIAAAMTDILHPVVLCLGYILLMKATAFSQPFTHKLFNKLFHETDPIPEPVSDEEWNRE